MSTALVRPAASAGKPKRLLDQMRDVLRLKHYSLRTERSYCDWVERFIRFHNLRHPKEMGAPEITQFLTHLARVGNVAASTQNQQAKGRLRCHIRRSENGSLLVNAYTTMILAGSLQAPMTFLRPMVRRRTQTVAPGVRLLGEFHVRELTR